VADQDRAIGGGAAGQGLEGLRGDSHGAGIASAGGLAPDANRTPDRAGGQAAAGLDAYDRGGGGQGLAQPAGGATARQDQSFGQGAGPASDADLVGGLNEQQDALRAQAEAQSRPDATDAQDLQDKTRASQDVGSLDDNANL
jgi:hypothetical protein